MFLFISMSLLISTVMILLFFFLSKKIDWDFLSSSGFECGFSCYFSSRFSFSVHYFLVALIFLFFDLELSFIFFFILENFSSPIMSYSLLFFVLLLLLGLIFEWQEGNLNWFY